MLRMIPQILVLDEYGIEIEENTQSQLLEFMALNHLQNIRDGIQEGRFTTEAAVSQGIVLPTLQLLGWPVFDISVVIPKVFH